jgi:hypothetical protein
MEHQYGIAIAQLIAEQDAERTCQQRFGLRTNDRRNQPIENVEPPDHIQQCI